MSVAQMQHRAWARRRRADRFRTAAQIVSVCCGWWVVVSLCQWGNRWYLSTVYADSAGSWDRSVELLLSAHGALVRGLVLLVVCLAAAVVGWQLRVVRR